METTFGRTVETRRLKSNRQNRSNCSLANIDKSDKLNDFLIILHSWLAFILCMMSSAL